MRKLSMATIASAALLFAFLMVGHQTASKLPQLSTLRRQLLADEPPPPSPNFRTVAFGSSRTWGAGIANPEHDSYPGLMGAKNLAIRASGPEYSALCTYSMIGDDEIYDVIIIEYMLDWVSGALDVLAERLRKRFPVATIIFINMWSPRQYHHIPSKKTLNQMVKARMTSPHFTQDDLSKLLRETNVEDWGFEPYDRKVIEDAAQKVGGLILDLPSDPDPFVALKTYTPLYVLEDMTHFSEEGHRWIRDRISDMLDASNAKPSNRVLPWDSTDHCTTWFETGKTDFVTTMEMVDFKDGRKFALEAKSDPDENVVEMNHDTNVIELNNPWHQAGFLYVSYMSNGPEKIYPDALVRVKQNEKETAAMHLKPVLPNTPYGNNLHVVTHTYIGPVAPGMSRMTVHELTKGHKEHFRIVGVILSPHVFGARLAAAL